MKKKTSPQLVEIMQEATVGEILQKFPWLWAVNPSWALKDREQARIQIFEATQDQIRLATAVHVDDGEIYRSTWIYKGNDTFPEIDSTNLTAEDFDSRIQRSLDGYYVGGDMEVCVVVVSSKIYRHLTIFKILPSYTR